MNKVLLISANKAQSPYPVPPLGIALLAQVLQKEYVVRVEDGLGLSASGVTAILDEYLPDYICLSIRNIDDMVKGAAHSFLPEIMDVFVRPVLRYKKGLLILGGSGFTIFPGELLHYFGADFGIVGEGEKSLLQLLKALDKKDDPTVIEGVVQRGKGQNWRENSQVSLADPFCSDIDLAINYKPYRQRSSYPIQTKRGCVHNCIYCSYPLLEGRTYRKRNPVHVVDEIEAVTLRNDGPSLDFEFVDSTFNDPVGHAEAICQEIVKRGLKVRLRTMGMNPVNMTRNLLVLMKGAGFAQIDVTPDSASPSVLKRYRKNFSLNHLVQAATLIRECEMPTMWFFIFGGPGETQATIEESFSFIDAHVAPDDMVNITEGLRIYPDTHLADLAIQEGVIGQKQSLLFPQFYVSTALHETQLSECIDEMISTRPNCIRLTETKPPPELLRAALQERKEKGLREPMFRTLLRLKRQQKR